jgi:ABC-2 type transport system ATP-binding protein
LDVQTRTATWEYVKTLKKELGMTLFLTTHYLEEADALCDRVAIINHGRILVTGSPSELKGRIGGDIIALSILDNVDISSAIERVPRVKEVRRQENSYVIKVEDGEGTVPDIIDAVKAEGHRVIRLSLTKPTLDEVYMGYTGRSMREEEGSRTALLRDRETMQKASGGRA